MKRVILLILFVFCVFSVKLSAQSITVSGTVWGFPFGGGTAEKLAGVTVIEDGSPIGTVTGLDGKFTLTVSSRRAKVKFIYIGFITETLVACEIQGFPNDMIVLMEEEFAYQSEDSWEDDCVDIE